MITSADDILKQVEFESASPESHPDEIQRLLPNVSLERELARVPESGFERLLGRLVSGLGPEVLKALRQVSDIPGVTETGRWISITPERKLRVNAEWEASDENVAKQIEDRVNGLVREAIKKWSERACIQRSLSESVATFLNRARRLEEKGLIDSAMDIIYDSVDELLRRGQFALCDSVLLETDANAYSSDILLALLTATAPARSELSARSKFYRSVKNVLKSRKEYERGLLDGLG